MKTEEYFAGTIVLRDKVIVGDPCYSEIENVAVLNNVLEGTYNCFVKKGDIDGGSVMSIEVKHHQYQHLANEPFYIMEGGFGVDSGQAGIYDYDYHQEYHQFDGWILENEGSKEQAWYNRIWVLMNHYDINNNHIEGDANDFKGERRDFAIMDNSALVSISGLGDGGYDIEVAKEDGFIKAIRVVFIDEENPYDEEDDYEDDDDEDC